MKCPLAPWLVFEGRGVRAPAGLNTCPLMRHTPGQGLLMLGGHLPSSCLEKSEKEERNEKLLTGQTAKVLKELIKTLRRKMEEMLREILVMRGGDEVDGLLGGQRLVQWQDGARLERSAQGWPACMKVDGPGGKGGFL